VTGKIQDDTWPCRYYDAVALQFDQTQEEEIGNLLVRMGRAAVAFENEEVAQALKQKISSITTSVGDQDNDDDWDEDKPDNQRESKSFESNFDDEDGDGDRADVADFLERFDFNFPDQLGEGVEDPVKSVLKAFVSSSSSSSSSSSVAGAPKAVENGLAPVLLPNDGFLRHPTVYWHQTPTHIILTVELPDIQTYSLQVGSDYRSIRCTISTPTPPNYGFVLKLFGKVLANPVKHLTGQALKIKLEKRMGNSNWIRVLSDKNLFSKLKWLREHPELFQEVEQLGDEEVDEEQEERERINEFKARNNLNLDNYELDDEDEEGAQGQVSFLGDHLEYNPIDEDSDDDEEEDEEFEPFYPFK